MGFLEPEKRGQYYCIPRKIIYIIFKKKKHHHNIWKNHVKHISFKCQLHGYFQVIQDAGLWQFFFFFVWKPHPTYGRKHRFFSISWGWILGQLRFSTVTSELFCWISQLLSVLASMHTPWLFCSGSPRWASPQFFSSPKYSWPKAWEAASTSWRFAQWREWLYSSANNLKCNFRHCS